MRLTLKTALAALAILTAPTLALAQGLSSGFPVLGGPAYCNDFVNGVCRQTVPAGPFYSGNERIQADTGLSAGRSPQTVVINPVTLGGGAIQLETPLTGATVNVNATGAGTPAATTTTGKLLIQPAGTIATLTVNLPPAANLISNQRLSITCTQTITALTIVAGSGTTINNNPTACTPSLTGTYGFELVYRAANAQWYRLQ